MHSGFCPPPNNNHFPYLQQTAHDSPTVERNFSGVTLKRVSKANNGRLCSSSQPKAIEEHVDRFQNIRTNPDISFLRSLSSDNYNGSAWNGTGGYSNARIGVPYTTINKAGVHYSTSPSDSSNHQGSATIFRATRSPLKSDLWPTYVTWSPRSKFAYGDRYCTYGNSEKDSVKEDRRKKKRRRRVACIPAWLCCLCCLCCTVLAAVIGVALYFALRKYFCCYFCQEVASKTPKKNYQQLDRNLKIIDVPALTRRVA
ncbi:unnamed protein product [Rotaria socialis]|uniref:Uncharacterized protein n=1 Tax=Rotaria socialis TaxID=392032 RepID=A0A821S1R6_9BILA|nr:unnamed protein product [Rotaria socialis]